MAAPKRARNLELAAEAGAASELTIYVNGEKHVVADAQPETTLLEWLRSIGTSALEVAARARTANACPLAPPTPPRVPPHRTDRDQAWLRGGRMRCLHCHGFRLRTRRWR